MRDPVLLRTVELDPDEIDVAGRKRPFSEAAVESLIASFTELKVIKDEILVRDIKHRGGKLKLIAGLHRLEACRRMGRKVPAKVYDCADEWAELMELDDNIAGAELTVLDTAVFLSERKRLYEKLHPEKKRGVAGSVGRWDATADNAVASFAASAAEKLGIRERQVYSILAAAKSLAPDEVGRLRSAPRPVNLSDLQQIAKIGQPTERYDVVAWLAEGKAKSAAEARRQWVAAQPGAAEPTVHDPIEDAFKTLSGAWKRAPMAAKKRFLFEHASAVWEAQNKGVPLDKWREAGE